MLPEVLLVFAPKDNAIAGRAVQHLRQHLQVKDVSAITRRDNFAFVNRTFPHSAKCLDEDQVIPGVSYESLKDYFSNRGVAQRRVGWYYQQFLKMAYSLHTQQSHYLIWDADTLLLRPMNFLSKDGKTLFSKHERIWDPYFVTMYRLLGLDRQVDFSFIGEHMMVETAVMRELLSAFGSKHNWVWTILDAVSDRELERSGFSEYETYGNFMSHHYPEKVQYRTVPHFRDGARYFGHHPTQWDLQRLAKKYHYVTFESSRRGKWRRVALQRMISALDALFQ